MRHISKLLRDLGFNEDASPSVQMAFYRHLIRHANLSTELTNSQPQTQSQAEQQLSFDKTILAAGNTTAAARKLRTR